MKFTQIYLDNFTKTSLVVALLVAIYLIAVAVNLVTITFSAIAATAFIALVLSIIQIIKQRRKTVD